MILSTCVDTCGRWVMHLVVVLWQNGMTVTIMAARYSGDVAIVKDLLGAGADTEVVDYVSNGYAEMLNREQGDEMITCLFFVVFAVCDDCLFIEHVETMV